MALKYNGTSPTAIKYNGTDLTVVKYGSTVVWGKPYSLSISAGSNTSVTVTRTSSPNQGASTGTLSSGSVIYYGDVLTISYSVSSGYKINTATVNGSTFTSGQQFTVTSAISVVTSAVASASWKTVWTGTKSTTLSSSSSTGTLSGLSGLKTGVPTRISGKFLWYEENTMWDVMTISFSNFEVGKYMNQNTDYTAGTINDFSIETSASSQRCYWNVSSVSTTSLGIKYRKEYTSPDYAMFILFYGSNGLTVTKVEQYY